MHFFFVSFFLSFLGRFRKIYFSKFSIDKKLVAAEVIGKIFLYCFGSLKTLKIEKQITIKTLKI